MSERLVDQFTDMVRIDSECGDEQRMIEFLLEEAQVMGATVILDDYGNLVASFPARGCEGAEPLLLACHADTVAPGVGIEPVIEDGIIRSAGDTILGADDKAGIAEIFEALRIASVHPPVELVATREEEAGLQGVQHLDTGLLTARRGYFVDGDGVDTIVIGGPAYYNVDVVVHGEAAHVGRQPGRGVNAILLAAKAVTALPLGRVDESTVANVGVIHGGVARNGVPDKVWLQGEVRSASQEAADRAVAVVERIVREQVEAGGGRVEVLAEALCRAGSLSDDAWTVRTAVQALARAGVQAHTETINRYTDACIYNARGIEVSVLGTGVRQAHTTEEHVAIADMERVVAALVEILRMAAV